MRFFCHISFLQFSGELYSHLVLYFITIGFADYRSKFNNAAGSRWLQDASYFVVKNINLGYRIPKRLTDKINVKGILLNASVENLVTITSLKGMNPQYSFTGSSDDTYGTARVFNLGVTLDL